MTKIIKAKYKLSRQFGVTLTDSAKDTQHKRNFKPGQHGTKPTKSKSDYGLHLRAKQRLKFYYGCGRITEKQFRNLFSLAQRKRGNTEANFISLLESLLPTLVYRMGIASSLAAARQIVRHGHIKVNDQKVDIPSYKVQVGDVITVKDKSKNLSIILENVATKKSTPEYLQFDSDKLEGKFLRLPTIDEVPYPFEAEPQKIVELYSR